VAVLSSASANTRFGGARAALGKVIKLNDVLFTVVGVTEAGYVGLAVGSDYEMAVPITSVPAMQHRPAGRAPTRPVTHRQTRRGLDTPPVSARGDLRSLLCRWHVRSSRVAAKGSAYQPPRR
jgi:hypothetical protein